MAARGAFEGPKSTEEVAQGVRGSALDRFGADLGSIWGGRKCLAYRQGRVAEHFCRNSLFLPSRAPRARFWASQTPFRRLFGALWGHLIAPWAPLWGPRAPSVPLRALLWTLLGALLGALGRPWDPRSRAVLGSIWGRFLVDFGVMLGGFSLRFARDCAQLVLRFFVRWLAPEHV